MLKTLCEKPFTQCFFFFLDGFPFFDFRLVVEREKLDKEVTVMYRSVKRKIASCLGVLGKRRRDVSNNHDPPTVCCAVGDVLWTR